MAIAHVQTVGRIGVRCFPLIVEVDVSTGLPSFTVVGLPDTVIQESKERIRAAIKNSGLTFPLARITVNLAPSDIKKEGIGFDLPIALGILAASQQIPKIADTDAFFGELGLEGQCKTTRGVLPFVLHSPAKRGFVPMANSHEARLAPRADNFYGVTSLLEVTEILKQQRKPQPLPQRRILETHATVYPDFADIAGQTEAKRMLEIAAAGHHNTLLLGPPGAGKTLLARAFPGILPPLTSQEQLEVTQIQSIAGLLHEETPIVTERPFRGPHHSATAPALLGGGSPPRPGEITLAHHGVLFLDECAEFSRPILEALRQPLEDRVITVARAGYSVTFPANILVLLAMNPCPCGYKDDPYHDCTCSQRHILQYEQKLSGPILDRIDLMLTAPAVSVASLHDSSGETTASIRDRVMHARAMQSARYKDQQIPVNAAVPQRDLLQWCQCDKEAMAFLHTAAERLRLSIRAYYKVLRVGRTIADLEAAPCVTVVHLGEALHYRLQR